MTRTSRQRLRLALLRAFARFTHSPDPKHPASPGKTLPSGGPRILVIRPDHLGDLLFATPALRALRQCYPDAQITALVGPWGAPVLHNNPHLDEIITLPFPGFSREPKQRLWQPYRLLRQWARRLYGRYDLAFILRFDHWWGALLAYQAKVPQRIGYAMPEVKPFLSHAAPHIPGRHEVEQDLRLIRSAHQRERAPATFPATPTPADSPLEFHIPRSAIDWAESRLGKDRPVVIHPGSGAAIKLWQVESWAAAADALSSEAGATILLTGSQTERPLCLQIAEQMTTHARVIAGETTLDQLAAILARCRLALGPDNGPLHLAVAVGTPTVHLFGPADPQTFGPWGDRGPHRVVVSEWPCIPCNRLDYSPAELVDHPCVREISVDAVMSAARQALRS